jgi:ElaB/YqjD/DUF883 family membrane-anchored ribosome-binding protein
MSFELEKFSEKEIEELFYPPKKTLLKKVLERIENVIQAYPVHALGLAFAIGVLIGVTMANLNSKEKS